MSQVIAPPLLSPRDGLLTVALAPAIQVEGLSLAIQVQLDNKHIKGSPFHPDLHPEEQYEGHQEPVLSEHIPSALESTSRVPVGTGLGLTTPIGPYAPARASFRLLQRKAILSLCDLSGPRRLQGTAITLEAARAFGEPAIFRAPHQVRWTVWSYPS